MSDFLKLDYLRLLLVNFIKWFFAVLAVLSLFIIKRYFLFPENEFIELLRKSGFHPSVVNNPYIVFKNKAAIKIPYNNWLASWLLSGFYLFTKYKCWKKGTKCFYLLKLLNMQDAYVNDILLLYDNFNFSPYKEIDVSNGKSEKHNIVIYSVIVGDYDEILDPVYISEGCDYILFTDNKNIKSDIWKIHLLPELDFDNIRRARHVKIMAHQYLDEKYDCSIYVDGRTFIYGDIKQLVNSLQGNLVVFITHSFNTLTIRDEAKMCLKCNVVTEFEVNKQLNKYFNDGFPDNIGMVETGLLIRNHNHPKVKGLMNIWWQEIREETTRDQLSIMYVLWKTEFELYSILKGSVWNNQYSIILKHK
ncbi:MAG: DUF616 domain-containing protein [Paludibacter sp.]|nr:DUF616 domain-containing protein [Paludibacter sp.]